MSGSGVNFFDTANVYSQGLSEEILGEAIRQVPREALLISTKATLPFGDGPNNMGSSRHHLFRQIEGSLKRLKTDYIGAGFVVLAHVNLKIMKCRALRTSDECVVPYWEIKSHRKWNPAQ